MYYGYNGQEIEDLEMANMRRDAHEVRQERTLVEPISINTVNKLQEAIGALQDYHNDSLGIDEWGDGPDCRNCEMCQAVKAMKRTINSIYTAVGLEPLYNVK